MQVQRAIKELVPDAKEIKVGRQAAAARSVFVATGSVSLHQLCRAFWKLARPSIHHPELRALRMVRCLVSTDGHAAPRGQRQSPRVPRVATGRRQAAAPVRGDGDAAQAREMSDALPPMPCPQSCPPNSASGPACRAQHVDLQLALSGPWLLLRSGARRGQPPATKGARFLLHARLGASWTPVACRTRDDSAASTLYVAFSAMLSDPLVTPSQVRAVEHFAREEGLACVCYHGEMPPEERQVRCCVSSGSQPERFCLKRCGYVAAAQLVS